MEINSLSKGYRKYNEDMVFVIKDHLFAVIDAKTGLDDPINPPSDGVFLIKELKEEILNLYRSNKLKAKSFVKQMNLISKRVYRKFIKGHKNLQRYQFPYASIALVYIDICDVHVFTIGDVSAFIRFKNKKARYISDRSIPLLDKKALEDFGSLEKAMPRLRENCSILNKGGRRSCYSLYKKPNLKFKHELFDIRELNDLYICSDGYYQAFEIFRLYKNRRELFSYRHDLQEVYKGILAARELDPNRIKYPRLKETDDISCVRVIF